MRKIMLAGLVVGLFTGCSEKIDRGEIMKAEQACQDNLGILYIQRYSIKYHPNVKCIDGTIYDIGDIKLNTQTTQKEEK